MKLPGSGYAPTHNTQPGTPPHGPAGASSANANTHRLAITARGLGSTVHLDGHDIGSALTGLTLTLSAGQAPTATLDLAIHNVTELQDSETRILIPDATRDALIALGWTPPADEPKKD